MKRLLLSVCASSGLFGAIAIYIYLLPQIPLLALLPPFILSTIGFYGLFFYFLQRVVTRPFRTHSSVGQSNPLITGRSKVQVLLGPLVP